MEGWITLHRKIEENELWLSEPFTRGQAWVDLLLIANHTPKLLYKRNIPITIERGQVGWSQERLAKRWKWGRRKVSNFLKTLENAQQIINDNNHTLSHIIIVNYEKYQKKHDKQHNSRTTDSTNNNNDNNENNLSGVSPEQKDMTWKNQRRYEEGEDVVIDSETGEVVPNAIVAEKAEVRELNEKIRHNLKLVEEARGLPFGKGRDMNYHVKIYRELLQNGWTHQSLVSAMLELVNSDHWITERKVGQYPGMNTVQFLLRNKKPA